MRQNGPILQEAHRLCLTSAALHRGLLGDAAMAYCQVGFGWMSPVTRSALGLQRLDVGNPEKGESCWENDRLVHGVFGTSMLVYPCLP